VQRKRIHGTPRHRSFRIQAFEIADQQQPEAASWRQTRAAHVVSVESLAESVDVTVEVMPVENLIQPRVERMHGGPRQVLSRHPYGLLRVSSSVAHRHRRHSLVQTIDHVDRFDASRELRMHRTTLNTSSAGSRTRTRVQCGLLLFFALFALKLTAVPHTGAATANVDCSTGTAIGPILNGLRPGDVVLVQGTCQENILIQAQLQHITLDGQRKATIKAPDSSQPALQVLGREVTIKGFTVTGGSFGIAINRGATALIDANTIRNAANTGLEVSQNSFARIINNTIEHSGQNGIFVLGSSSAHIGVVSTGDTVAQPNIIQDNGGDGIQVLRASTARIIGNMLRVNQGNGLTVQQASHADVAGNTFNGNRQHGIRVVGNSGVNLADSAMRLFEQVNTTTVPNGIFGVRCEIGAYVEGPLGSLVGSRGVKDMSDTSCIDRSSK